MSFPRRRAPDDHTIGANAGERLPGQRGQARQWWVLLVIAVGGILGAAARHGLQVLWPVSAEHVPWATFIANVSGSFLIGILMVSVVEVRPHPLVRPFLGVGLLGGYTTFSTYAVETHTLLREADPLLPLVYLFGTLAAALSSVVLGVLAARAVLRVRRWSSPRGGAG